MTDFVAKTTQQGADKVGHLLATVLALGIVGFGEVDGDDAVGVLRLHLCLLLVRRRRETGMPAPPDLPLAFLGN